VRIVVALLLALLVALPALADDPEPYLRDCRTSQYGDLGRGWKEQAVLAGPLAFVGMRNGLRASGLPQKILVVVESRRVATVTVAARSRAGSALGYNGIQPRGGRVPLASGTHSVRFEACAAVASRAPWNRGTQFGGYVLAYGRKCVYVEVRADGKLTRRALRFGVARCP
jgi:hypothetical protein